MPELIHKDLLVRTLRYMDARERGGATKIDIDTRVTTNKRVIEILIDQGYVGLDEKVSEKGRQFLVDNRLCAPFEVSYTPYGVVYEKNNAYLARLREILALRPAPNYEIDHQPLLPDLTGMRAHYISSEENLFDKTIAMVGDYDSTGIGINIATKVKQMTIFDIDERLLKYFSDIAAQNDYPIDCVMQNLFEEVPERFVGQFDVFVTDPPYAMGGMRKFIEFGIKLLKDGGVGYIAVPYHDSIAWTERMLYEVNKLAVENGCVITDTFRNFHRYQTADGLRSSMVRIKKGSSMKQIDQLKMYSYKRVNVNVPEESAGIL